MANTENTPRTARTTAAAANAEALAAALAELAALREQVAELAARPVATPRKAAAPKPQVACACSNFASPLPADAAQCDATTTATFAPGHDARLKGRLLRAAVAGAEVTDTRTGAARDPQLVAAEFGFSHQVAAGLARHRAAADAKLAAALAKANAAAEAAAQTAK